MKRTLPLVCSIIFASSCVYAEQTTVSNKQMMQQSDYQHAIQLYKQKDYSKSFRAFEKLIDKYSQNELVNFYYARSAFEMGNYDTAFMIYDKILINNPTNHRARLELARTLFMMKSYDQAKAEFEKVLIAPIPITVRKNVEKFLTAIESKNKGYHLNKVAIFGFGWTDNVGSNSGDKYLGNIDLGDNTAKSDSHLKTILVGNLIVPFKSNPKFAWETLGIGYVQEQLKYHTNDIWLLSLNSGVSYKGSSYKNTTSLLYDRISVESDSNMYYYGLGNSFIYDLGITSLGIDLTYKKKKMFKEVDQNAHKNTTTKEFGFSYKIPIKKHGLEIALNATYKKERQDHKEQSAPDYNKNITKYKVSAKKTLPLKIVGTLSYQKEYGNYKNLYDTDYNLVGDTKRDDSIDTITLKLEKPISKTKTISLELGNTKANSTIDSLYSYHKRTANINYTFLF